MCSTLALFMRAVSQLLKDGWRPVPVSNLASTMRTMSGDSWSAQAALGMRFIEVCRQAAEVRVLQGLWACSLSASVQCMCAAHAHECWGWGGAMIAHV